MFNQQLRHINLFFLYNNEQLNEKNTTTIAEQSTKSTMYGRRLVPYFRLVGYKYVCTQVRFRNDLYFQVIRYFSD